MTPEAKAEYNRAYRDRNREKLRASARAYYYAHHEDKKAAHREWGKNHTEARREYLREWHKKNPDKHKIYYAACKRRDPLLGRSKALKRKYGLTIAAVDSLLESQNGTCAICHSAEWGTHGPVVDHDHTGGDVRGILCHQCNSALGMIRENQEIAKSMIRYLKGGDDD